jgi:fructokinase
VIVVAGESLVDLLVRTDGSVVAIPGGGPYNAARALGRLGIPVAFLGRLSTDVFGRDLRARLLADGVDLSLAPTTDDPTTLAVAELDASGAASYRFHTAGTAAARLAASDVPGPLPARTTALHVGTLGLVLEPIAGTIEGVVAGTSEAVLVMVDPNIRPAAITDPAAYRARLIRVLGRADVVKVSDDDLAWLEPDADAESGARRLLAHGPAAVLVTSGPRPVHVVTAAVTIRLPVPEIPVVDTIGAGDAFGAGFLAAWTRTGRARRDLDDVDAIADATRFAVRVGSATTARSGAEPPWLVELEAERDRASE